MQPVRAGYVRLRDDNSLLVGLHDHLQQLQQFRLVHAPVPICTYTMLNNSVQKINSSLIV